MGTLWADSIKFAMKWSAQLHFVDIQSEFEKAGNCEYQSDRDCPNGNCVVGAIANYSRQLVTGCSALDGTATSLFKTARSNFVLPLANRKPPRPNVSPPSPPNTTQALLFLIHFMGDVTQPLHACAKDRGGNDDKAKFGKTTTNLHSGQ